MESTRFDTIVRTLAGGASRRDLTRVGLGALGVALSAVGLSAFVDNTVTAKGKNKKKGKDKKKDKDKKNNGRLAPSASPPPPPPEPSCAEQAAACKNRWNGHCEFALTLDQEQCRNEMAACCEHTRDCDGETASACVNRRYCTYKTELCVHFPLPDPCGDGADEFCQCKELGIECKIDEDCCNDIALCNRKPGKDTKTCCVGDDQPCGDGDQCCDLRTCIQRAGKATKTCCSELNGPCGDDNDCCAGDILYTCNAEHKCEQLEDCPAPNAGKAAAGCCGRVGDECEVTEDCCDTDPDFPGDPILCHDDELGGGKVCTPGEFF